MRRKLLALFLVLCLMLPLIPAVTLAEDVTTSIYERVTSAPEDWSGKYLIVCMEEEPYYAMNSKLSTIDATGNYVEVDDVNDRIEVAGDKDVFFTIAKNGEEYYSILSQSGKYIGKNAYSNGLDTSDEPLQISLSIDADGEAKITGKGSCTLRFNSSNDQKRFRFYKSGQQPVYLYRFVGNGTVHVHTYTVRYEPGEAEADPLTVNDATNPYVLLDCMFEAPEGCIFNGWLSSVDNQTYAQGAEVTLTEDTTFTAQWTEKNEKTYKLVTNEDELIDGGYYLIASAGEQTDSAYVLSLQNTNNRASYASVSITADRSIVLNANEFAKSNEDNKAFELKLEGSVDNWAINDQINGYLYAAGGNSSDYLKSKEQCDENCYFSIRILTDGSADIVTTKAIGRNTLRFYAANNPPVFSCYETDKQQPVYLYKLVDGTEPPADKPEIESWSVVLSGQIGMNFYMTIPKGYQPDTMKITIGSREVTAKGVKQDDGRYKFTCYLTSVEMAEQITAVYTYEVDGTEARESKTTSIQGYLNEIIVNIDHKEEYEKAKALAKALLNYGYYAQKAVADGVNHPETDETYIGEANLPTEITGYVTEPTLDSSIITGVTYSLSLDTETALNIYLTTADGCVLSKDNVVISATGAYVEYSVDKVGSRYRVKITGIGAHELGTVITVTIGNSTIQASALTYVQKCLVNDKVKQATKNAAAALYRYYQEAIIYAGGAEG